jgi:drug/metabolite transporter (DMT)-like permease
MITNILFFLIFLQISSVLSTLVIIGCFFLYNFIWFRNIDIDSFFKYANRIVLIILLLLCEIICIVLSSYLIFRWYSIHASDIVYPLTITYIIIMTIFTAIKMFYVIKHKSYDGS